MLKDSLKLEVVLSFIDGRSSSISLREAKGDGAVLSGQGERITKWGVKLDCEIVTVGDELTSGLRIDTNSAYIASRLSEVGVECKRQIGVRDNVSEIASCVNEALGRADILFVTGGLGSTIDDVTREGIAEALGSNLVFDSKIADLVDDWFRKRGTRVPQEAYHQAYLPKGAKPIMPAEGTAPGVMLEVDKKIIFVLPGVPQEMKKMFEQDVFPYLEERFNLKKKVLVRTIKTCGVREALLARHIREIALRYQDRVMLSSLPYVGEVHIRLIARIARGAKKFIAQAEDDFLKVLGEKVYGFDDDTLQSVVGRLLTQNKLTLAVAESCTGGLVGHLITQIPGSSNYFWGGVIAYSNEAKERMLKVPSRILQEKGAVSREAALALAKKIREFAGVDLGVGITGIAGPTGGTTQKPVGLVYVALSSAKRDSCRRFLFPDGREEIKLQSGMAALNMLRLFLIKEYRKKGAKLKSA